MKNNDIQIPYVIRRLSQNKPIQGMINDLYINRKNTHVFSIYRPLVNKYFNSIAEENNHEGLETFDELSKKLDDTILLDELIRLHVISISEEVCSVETDDFSVCIKMNNPEYIENLNAWCRDMKLILNYGVFSLHTFTGEAYCLDKKGVFHTGKGLFRVFLAFLKEENHILDYSNIYKIYHADQKHLDMERMLPENIHQIIHDIKENLSMKEPFSKLFLTSANQYILSSEPDA